MKPNKNNGVYYSNVNDDWLIESLDYGSGADYYTFFRNMEEK